MDRMVVVGGGRGIEIRVGGVLVVILGESIRHKQFIVKSVFTVILPKNFIDWKGKQRRKLKREKREEHLQILG